MEHATDSLPKARNWLRLLFHCVVCPASYSCSLGARCDEAKHIIGQIMGASRVPTAGNEGAFSSIISLLQHYISCQDGSCSICSAVWAVDEPPTAAPPPSPSSPASPSGPPAPLPPPLTEPEGSEGTSSAAAVDSEQLGDAYAASRMLHYLLYCLLAREGQAPAVVHKGKAIWHAMLGPEPTRALDVAARNGRRLLQHRVACQHGRSCAVCGCALSFFARTNHHKQQLQQQRQAQQQAGSSSSSSSRRGAATATGTGPAAQSPDAAALTLELEALLKHMATELANLRV